MNNGTRLALLGIIAIVMLSEVLAPWSRLDMTNIALTGLGALGGWLGSEAKHALTDQKPDKPIIS